MTLTVVTLFARVAITLVSYPPVVALAARVAAVRHAVLAVVSGLRRLRRGLVLSYMNSFLIASLALGSMCLGYSTFPAQIFLCIPKELSY